MGAQLIGSMVVWLVLEQDLESDQNSMVFCSDYIWYRKYNI
jgi:hypothetical protein